MSQYKNRRTWNTAGNLDVFLYLQHPQSKALWRLNETAQVKYLAPYLGHNNKCLFSSLMNIVKIPKHPKWFMQSILPKELSAHRGGAVGGEGKHTDNSHTKDECKER